MTCKCICCVCVDTVQCLVAYKNCINIRYAIAMACAYDTYMKMIGLKYFPKFNRDNQKPKVFLKQIIYLKAISTIASFLLPIFHSKHGGQAVIQKCALRYFSTIWLITEVCILFSFFEWKNALPYGKVYSKQNICLRKQFTIPNISMMSLKMLFTPFTSTSEYISF